MGKEENLSPIYAPNEGPDALDNPPVLPDLIKPTPASEEAEPLDLSTPEEAPDIPAPSTDLLDAKETTPGPPPELPRLEMPGDASARREQREGRARDKANERKARLGKPLIPGPQPDYLGPGGLVSEEPSSFVPDEPSFPASMTPRGPSRPIERDAEKTAYDLADSHERALIKIIESMEREIALHAMHFTQMRLLYQRLIELESQVQMLTFWMETHSAPDGACPC